MNQVDQVREKTDIVALLSEYISLKPAGRNFKANCPFHHEKTPSFVVSPERQIWHCFGCSRGGDVYTFLMEFEQMEFAEALRFLANRSGIKLLEFKKEGIFASRKETLYGLNHLTAEFYHYLLTKHRIGKNAMDYLLNERGLNRKVIETFKIGFAPNSEDALSKFLLKKKGYSENDLFDAGVALKRGGKAVDFFFNRIIFPLIDQRDNIVGFSARGLTPRAIPKYINTKDTLIYNKSYHLYGINNTKKEIKNKNQAIIVEGEFDVISLFQQGIINVVGIKGTAFTEHQLNLLKRYCNKIILFLDKDNAGKEAVIRSIPLIEKLEFLAGVISLDNSKDPDEAVRNNLYEVKEALKHDEDVYEYLLKDATSKYNPQTPEGKTKIAKMLLPIYANISNEIIKEHYLRKLGTKLETTYESISKEVEKYKKDIQVQVIKKQETVKKNREQLLEEYILSLFIQAKDLSEVKNELDVILKNYPFSLPSYKRLYDNLSSFINRSPDLSINKFADSLPQELRQVFDICYIAPIPQFKSNQDFLKEITQKALELKKIYIRNKIRQGEDSANLEQIKDEYLRLERSFKNR